MLEHRLPAPTGAGERGRERIGIERCSRCGGAFFDFFDGTPGRLARCLDRLELAQNSGGSAKGGSNSNGHDQPVGDCPECRIRLARHDELEGVFRCSGCFGVFATPAGLHVLAETFVVPPEPQGSLLERLIGVFWERER
jgi:Zn-finger nucleic acid-binding protein